MLDQDPLHRAPRAIHDRRAIIVVLVNDTELNRLWYSQTKRRQPNHDDKFHGTGQFRHRVGDERMTYCNVSERTKFVSPGKSFLAVFIEISKITQQT